MTASHDKFDPARAAEYGRQARIALGGYDACHELTACILAAALGAEGAAARVLAIGAGGTGGEILAAARLSPGWRFAAVDPSAPMLALTRGAAAEAGIADRVEFFDTTLDALPEDEEFDAAVMIGVLHHLPGDEAKRALLAGVAARLRPGAPLALAGNVRAYASEPLLLAAWGNRWRLHGAGEAETGAKLATILKGAEPPASEDALAALLAAAGFTAPQRYFASLFWGAWIQFRA